MSSVLGKFAWDNLTIASVFFTALGFVIPLTVMPRLIARLRSSFERLILRPDNWWENTGLCRKMIEFPADCSRFRWIRNLTLLVFIALFVFFRPHFYGIETNWYANLNGLFFDIVNLIFLIVSVYFLAVNTWILIATARILSRLQKHRHIVEVLKIELNSPDRMGGLGPLRDILNLFLFVFFLSTGSLIVSEISPISLLSLEMVIYSLLMGIGIFLFCYVFRASSHLVKLWTACRIRETNRSIEELRQEAEEAKKCGFPVGTNDRLENIKNEIDILIGQRKDLEDSLVKAKNFRLKEGLPFISLALNVFGIGVYIRPLYEFNLAEIFSIPFLILSCLIT